MEGNFKDKLQTLKAFWEKERVKLNSGASKTSIENFQEEFGFLFECNFIKYLNEIGGFFDDRSDDAWFCFWNLNRMRDENKDNSHPKELIWFSDHSINLCCFGFHKDDQKIYTHFSRSKEIIFIANDFSEFVELYLENPYQLIK